VAARAKSRQFPTSFKLKAIKRAEGGGGVLPVARKLGISRKLLHDWIKAWKAHGPEGLNRSADQSLGLASSRPLQAEKTKHSALAQASARIAELERLVGRQQLDIDFFRKALRALERPQRKGKPVSASSKSIEAMDRWKQPARKLMYSACAG